MTAIVPASITTKKQLKQHLAEGQYLELKDPTPWGEDLYMLNVTSVPVLGGPLKQDYKVPERGSRMVLNVGHTIYCTNHPKRSWFAQLKLTEKGWRVT